MNSKNFMTLSVTKRKYTIFDNFFLKKYVFKNHAFSSISIFVKKHAGSEKSFQKFSRNQSINIFAQGVFQFSKNLLEFSTHKITHFYTKEFLSASFFVSPASYKRRAHIMFDEQILVRVKTVLPDYGRFSRIFS